VSGVIVDAALLGDPPTGIALRRAPRILNPT